MKRSKQLKKVCNSLDDLKRSDEECHLLIASDERKDKFTFVMYGVRPVLIKSMASALAQNPAFRDVIFEAIERVEEENDIPSLKEYHDSQTSPTNFLANMLGISFDEDDNDFDEDDEAEVNPFGGVMLTTFPTEDGAETVSQDQAQEESKTEQSNEFQQ